MKKTLLALTAAALMAMPAYAATTQSVPVTASVGTVLDLTMTVHERAAGTDLPLVPTVSSMAFGQLVSNGFGALVGSKNYAVYLNANTSSRKYNITSTMPSLTTSGATPSTLPNAMGMLVISAKDAANTDITGDTFTGIRSAIMSSQEIYRSNDSGTGATLELWYGIAGYAAGGVSPFTGFSPVQPDQAAGDYSSSITYTMTLI